MLAEAGIERPRLFLAQYVMSYLATKLAVLMMSVSGYAPELMGCTNSSFLVRLTVETSRRGELRLL